jgi:hypothetical protein
MTVSRSVEKYTIFDIQKLRKYEYKHQSLVAILKEKLSSISSKIEEAKFESEITVHILKREKCQKYFNQQKMQEIKSIFIFIFRKTRR